MRSSSTSLRSLVMPYRYPINNMRSRSSGSIRRSSGFAVAVFQLLPHKLKADVLVDQPQQVGFRNLIFQAEVMEQRFGAVVLPHHDQQASDNQNPTEHV